MLFRELDGNLTERRNSHCNDRHGSTGIVCGLESYRFVGAMTRKRALNGMVLEDGDASGVDHDRGVAITANVAKNGMGLGKIGTKGRGIISNAWSDPDEG